MLGWDLVHKFSNPRIKTLKTVPNNRFSSTYTLLLFGEVQYVSFPMEKAFPLPPWVGEFKVLK